MQSSWRLMKWRGVPVVLHWTVLIGLPWLYFRHATLEGMVIAFAGFLFLLMAHELGHAAVAKWRRVRVLEIRLMFMHGLCRHEEPYDEVDDIWIAWGGVAAQFAVFLVAMGTSALLQRYAFEAYLNAGPLLHLLTVTNLFIIALNLIPIPPFDGAKAWRALPLLWARWGVKRLLRNRKFKKQSKDVAADIIERLKKRP